MKRIISLAVICSLALAAIQAPVPARALNTSFTVSTTVPTLIPLSAGGSPQGVATDGTSIFLASENSDRIDVVNATTGAVTFFSLPDDAAEIAFNPFDGRLYVTEGDGARKVQEYTTAGVFVNSFTTLDNPTGIVADPTTGKVYWTEAGAGSFIGSASAGLVGVTETPAAGLAPELNYITIDSNENLWITDNGNNTIVEYDSSVNLLASLPVPTGSAGLQGITFNPPPVGDGNIWFAEQDANQVASVNPATHAITEFALTQVDGLGAEPKHIAPGPNGKLYFNFDGFNGRSGAGLGVISPLTSSGPSRPIGARIQVNFQAKAAGGGVIAGPDGNIWYAGEDDGNVGVLVPTYVLSGHGITFSASTTALFSGTVGSFSDENTTSNPQETYTVSINWGDGTAPSAGTYAATATPFVFNANGSHQYARAGTFIVKTTVTASDGRVATIFSRAIVR